MIRPATDADAAAILAIYAPIVRETAISFELEPPSVEEMATRIRTTLTAHPWLVDERDGRLRGYAYAARFKARPAYDRTCEVSVYVAPEAQGRGIGRALYTALFEELARRGVRQAIATITLPNEASVAMHERMGFRHVGRLRAVGFKFGAWQDVGLWQRPVGDR